MTSGGRSPGCAKTMFGPRLRGSNWPVEAEALKSPPVYDCVP